METLSLSKSALHALRLDESNEVSDTDIEDIAFLNLLCSAGLPGGPTTELSVFFAQLDAMAYRADCEIQRNYHRFLDDIGQFQYSQARFAVLMMITVLQQDFGVRYNPARIHDPDFRNAGDLFLHGLLGGDGGTCASMPVLYAAIGRRLGWPIKLATARGHVFCRWDDAEGTHPFGPQRFNIEGAGLGAAIVDDDYYRAFPEPITDAEVRSGIYLKSLSTDEELAMFLALRGHCLEDNRRIGKACDTYTWACRLAPHDPHYRAFWEHAERVRDRILEEETLREYFGNDVPLPFGLFPRHVLRQMSSEMRLAVAQHFDALQWAEQSRLEASLGRSRINHPTIGPLPIYPSLISAFPAGRPIESPQPNLHNLPARLLETWDHRRLMERRADALRMCRSLPSRAMIRQPLRPLLSANSSTPLPAPPIPLSRTLD